MSDDLPFGPEMERRRREAEEEHNRTYKSLVAEILEERRRYEEKTIPTDLDDDWDWENTPARRK